MCAGLIGELMSHNQPEPDPTGYRLHEVEHRIFQAAASAQRRTRVAISTHAALGRGGLAQLDVLDRRAPTYRGLQLDTVTLTGTTHHIST